MRRIKKPKPELKITASHEGHEYMTLKDASKQLGVEANALRMAAVRGSLHAERIGHMYMVTQEEIDRYKPRQRGKKNGAKGMPIRMALKHIEWTFEVERYGTYKVAYSPETRAAVVWQGEGKPLARKNDLRTFTQASAEAMVREWITSKESKKK